MFATRLTNTERIRRFIKYRKEAQYIFHGIVYEATIHSSKSMIGLRIKHKEQTFFLCYNLSVGLIYMRIEIHGHPFRIDYLEQGFSKRWPFHGDFPRYLMRGYFRPACFKESNNETIS